MKITILWLTVLLFPLFSSAQLGYGYDEDATQHFQCNAAFGLSTKNAERAYQLEFGVKSGHQLIWPSISGEVYTGRDFRTGTSKDPVGDRWSHTTLSLRINSEVFRSEVIGVQLYGGFGKHWTAEAGSVTSFDPQAGFRVIKYVRNPGAFQAGYSFSGQWNNTVDMNDNEVKNRLVFSVGLYFLL